ncbi:MAG: type II toxin-antitoxin system VapC family toxin [Bacteroidales bacterium]|nr:type II toxin-antitoxin system VapC family toxin [Bacteroidales bacterium]
MEKELICLDTSVLIDYYRKKIKSNSFFYEITNKYTLFAVSSITEYEIYIGSNSEQDKFWNDFFGQLTILAYDSKVNRTAIQIERELKKKRKQIDIPDLMIAATARTYNLKLATLNSKHFEIIDNLKLITKKP